MRLQLWHQAEAGEGKHRFLHIARTELIAAIGFLDTWANEGAAPSLCWWDLCHWPHSPASLHLRSIEPHHVGAASRMESKERDTNVRSSRRMGIIISPIDDDAVSSSVAWT